MEKKRKAEEDWDDKRNIKKARIEPEAIDLPKKLPEEILEIIFRDVDPLPLVLFSLTSKHWNNHIKKLPNKIWYEIYLAALQRFDVDISETILDEALRSAQGYGPVHEAHFEWEFNEDQDPLSGSCLNDQRFLVSEDEYLAEFPIKYFYEYHEDIPPIKDALLLAQRFFPKVAYKKLALKTQMKYHQFEIWRDSKPLNEAFSGAKCSCLKEQSELALYDEKDEEIALALADKPDNQTCKDAGKNNDSDSEIFEAGWDEEEDQSYEDDFNPESNSAISQQEEFGSQEESEVDGLETAVDQEMQVDDESSQSTDSEYDGYISHETRDNLFNEISSSERSLKLFIHVLSAIVIGHCPPPRCHDSILINQAKYERSIVRTGDIVDEVITQLKYAATLDQSSSLISVMICALQKLRVSDLLFLKQGAEEKYPYLSAIYSAYEVQNNVSEVFYIADGGYDFNLNALINPWTSYFQADIATDDDFDMMPDWLSIRHSIHRLMRKGGIVCATPNATEYALRMLVSFIGRTLGKAAKLKPVDDDSSKPFVVERKHIIEAMRKINCSPNNLYPDNEELYYENPIVMYSDSEHYSDESSVDSDWIDEPITDLEEQNASNSDVKQEEDANDDPLHSIIVDSLKKCVKFAQLDEVEEYESFESDEECNAEMNDKSAEQKLGSDNDVADEDHEEQILQYLDEYEESKARPEEDSAHLRIRHITKQLLVEEAIYYSGRKMSDNDETAQLFITKYEDDLPFHETPKQLQDENIILRDGANYELEQHVKQELEEFLKNKRDRMQNNICMYDASIRSDANECKTMIVDLIDNKALKHTIHNASQIIRSSSVLKSIKLMNLFCTHNDDQSSSLIEQLMSDIASSPSITSVVLFNCHFTSYASLTNLLRNKQLTKFHIVYPVDNENNTTEGEDEFLLALQQHESIQDLMLPIYSTRKFNELVLKEKYIKTLQSMLPRLSTLHLRNILAPSNGELGTCCNAIAEVLAQSHQLQLVVLHSWGKLPDQQSGLALILDQLSINYSWMFH